MRTLIQVLFCLLVFAITSSATVAQCGGRTFVSGSAHYSQPYREHGHVRAPQHGYYYHRSCHSAFRHSGVRHHR
jgi:hypothetical protein